MALVRIYELIVSESHTQNHCLLVHKPILNPLLRLFDWFVTYWFLMRLRSNKLGHPSATEKHFVVLLNQICTKLAEDRTLLHFFFSCAEGADQFIVFSLLIPYLYEQNDVGQLARDALLLILSVSANHEQIAEFVSAFCPVVATGLSGCFSQLSRILAGDGVERLVPEHTAESLANFHSSLLFCNAVVQAAHPAVVEQICSFFYSGFLISVVKPALLQDEQESVAAATVYLQLCIETVTEPSLLRTVIRMLLLERDDERRLLIEVIVRRIASGDKLYLISFNFQICSEDTLALYMHEGAQLVERRVRSCSAWKWRYDGVTPSPVLFRGDSDEEPNTHTVDLDTFISLLDRRSVTSKHKISSTEVMAFIDSKLQFMRELESEKTEAPQKEADKKEREPIEVAVTLELQITEILSDRSLLLECLMTQLEEMTDHSLAFNLQLANVLCSLAAYPQPLLVASIFNTSPNSKVPDLIRVGLRARVDSAASNIEGLDVYVGRALRTLNGRAEKMERHFDGYIARLAIYCR
ncbi:unnamed protein product [Haemonchus placei]|uniref:FHF complex subunit HOOK-interacting protein C-terminal domain-containing protein n=1 Tax=Haemonchus placei TaxID=6290 RepID=A0A3P7ZDD0_HAEPC|nr:unnamed protein product [Haemonchus placei]